ncbi:MAG: ATP-binding protein [Paracoccaceae bacterium]|nr:ATP-binding protein [Paracoccaceae bacterium]
MALQLMQNAAFISFLAIGLYFFWQRAGSELRLIDRLLIGLNFGVIAFLVTATPINMEDGATIDARAGPVILAGIVGGPPAAAVAAILGASARAMVGGSFSFSGVLVFFLYALAGVLLWKQLFKSTLGEGVTATRIVLGVFLSLIAAALMFFVIQPRSVAVSWLENDYPFIAAANALSVGFTGLVSYVAILSANQSSKIKEALDTLNLAKQSGGIGTWELDVKSNSVVWDDLNIALHGFKLKDNRGTYKDWAAVVHPDDLDRVNQELQALLDGTAAFDTTYRVVHSDGSIHHLKGNALVQRTASGDPMRVVGANIDLTPMIRKEEELEKSREMTMKSQKLEIIGQLSGGVAHDFNNLLAIIHGNMELLLEDEGKWATPATERLDSLTSAIAAARRGSDLTRGMLTFARKSHLEPQLLSVNAIVQETERWLTRTIPASIQVELNMQKGIWSARLDPASLQSAFVNIIVNARDAMPSGGKLTVETSNLRLDSEYLVDADADVPPGRYVLVAITDTGTGIEKELVPTVFEPFVSSKSPGIGTGLGLSMVKGFVEQSGGFVRLYSEVGVGTSVKMYFPAATEELAAGQSVGGQTLAQPELEPGKARILVAEDELEILNVIMRILKGAGYSADVAGSGDEALRQFQSDPTYDLLLTDIVMPGTLRGPDLARACREIRPDLPVIFLSGYASEATVHGNGLKVDDVRLMKPVARADLIKSIERSLEA